MSTETIEQYLSSIADQNAAFEAASDAGKRVIIAKDALHHLAMKRVRPRFGTYGYLVTAGGGLASESGSSTVDTRSVIAEGNLGCIACARGTLVYSAIVRRNSASGSRLAGHMYIPEFPSQMLRDIEQLFEAHQDDPDGYFWDCIVPNLRPLFIDNLLGAYRYTVLQCRWAEGIWQALKYDAELKERMEERLKGLNWDHSMNWDHSIASYRFARLMTWLVEHEGEFDKYEFLLQELPIIGMDTHVDVEEAEVEIRKYLAERA